MFAHFCLALFLARPVFFRSPHCFLFAPFFPARVLFAPFCCSPRFPRPRLVRPVFCRPVFCVAPLYRRSVLCSHCFSRPELVSPLFCSPYFCCRHFLCSPVFFLPELVSPHLLFAPPFNRLLFLFAVNCDVFAVDAIGMGSDSSSLDSSSSSS